MSEASMKNLRSVAASSAMEGLLLTQEHIDIITQIMDGKLTVQEYISSFQLNNNHEQL